MVGEEEGTPPMPEDHISSSSLRALSNGPFQLNSARCPFCRDTFPPHVLTDHCNYCVDIVGVLEKLGREQKARQEAQAKEVEEAVRSRGNNMGGGVASTLRGMVSQNKIRLQEDGFDLDLTYITPRCIAMGFPSHGTEGYYRNPVDEVERFFESRHKGCYRIYNLCSERQYDHPARFGRAYKRYPFDDHNAPAPITLIPEFCNDAMAFLAQNPKNVVAVHCKAGKGRTGVMVTALLMASISSLRKADDALKAFGDCRTHDGKGVTIPSQIRYVRYWEVMLNQHGMTLPEPRRLRVDKVVVHGGIKHGGCADPYFTICQGPAVAGQKGVEVFDSKKKLAPKQVQREWGYEWDLIGAGREVIICGDLKFMFKAKGLLFRSDEELFHFWINTAFTLDYLHFDKAHLDKACKDVKHDYYREDLAVEVFFYDTARSTASQKPQSVRSSITNLYRK